MSVFALQLWVILFYNKQIDFIVSTIGVLATCLTIISGSSILINNNINNNINNIVQDMNLSNSNNASASIININDEKSESELMRMAEVCFDNRDWKTLLEIYSRDKVVDNPIRNANLGYLYINGLGVNQDFMIAEHYYSLAIQKGCNDALQKKLLIYLKCNMLEEALDLIIENNSREEITNVILLLYPENHNINKETSDIVNSFFALDYLEQINLISKTYNWEAKSITTISRALSDPTQEKWKEYIQYKVMSTATELDFENNKQITYYTYVKEVYTSFLVHILNGDFIRMEITYNNLALE